MDRPLLLRTKFLVPRQRLHHVERPRLARQLAAAFQSRLTLVSAPAGYGKTTMLASLVRQLDAPVVWYQLDKSDNDPLVFLHYLIEGLRCTLAGFSGAALTLLDPHEFHPRRALMVLLNEVTATIENDFLVVLEDYHWIDNTEIHDLVNFVLQHLPPQMHFVMSTRTEPPLAMARLRASGSLVELRAGDLRFTMDEIAQLTAHLELDDSHLHLLEQWTEGWGAGLQLILTALGRSGAEPAEQLARRLGRQERYVFQYLAQEVFDQQPPEVQHFLLRSAVLNQMSAETVNALLGTADAERLLSRVERDGLFTTSLDEEQRWYRYHHLFRDFLLNHLLREAPEEALSLHVKAGDNYAARQLWDLAAEHYVAAQHPVGLARAIDALAPTYLQTGRVETLYRYIEALPAAMVRDTPDFLLYRGDALRYWGRLDAAVAAYEAAQAGYEASGERGRLCHTLTQLAGVSRSRGDYRRAQELAQRAVEAAGETDHAERAPALMALAKNTGLLENMGKGYRLGEKGLQEARLAGAALAANDRARLHWSQAQLAWWYGNPSATIAHCQSALAADQSEGSPQICRAYVMLSSPYLYRHNLSLARQFAAKGVSLAERLQFTEWLPMAHAALGNVVTRQDLVVGERHLRDAIALSRQLGEGYAQLMATGYLAFNLDQQGRPAEARQILEAALHLHGNSPETYELLVCRSVLGDVLVDIGDLDTAWQYFLGLRRVCEARQFRLPLGMIYFALSYLHLEAGCRESALDLLRRSLDIIGRADAIQLYLDQGQRAVTLCREAQIAGIRAPFVERVLKLLSAAQQMCVYGDLGGLTTVRGSDRKNRIQDDVIEAVTLGDFRLFYSGQELDREVGLTGKVRELLAYFITRRGQRLALERIVEDLWPALDPDRGQAVFHTTLYRLRRALRHVAGEGDYVRHEWREYELQADRFRIDADQFDECLSHALESYGQAAVDAYETAVKLYAGSYLANLYPEWCTAERRRLELAYITTLNWLTAHYTSVGAHHRAIATCQQLLEIDPLQEHVHCNLMRLWDRVGNRSAVVKQYEVLGQLLEDELGVDRLPETDAVYAEIMGNDLSGVATSGAGQAIRDSSSS